MKDFPFALKLADDPELVVFRDIRIDPMQLPEIDALQPQPAQAAFESFPQPLRPAVDRPLIRTGALEAAFRGDDETLRIRIECFGDQLFADVRTIRLRGVDEIDAELDGAAEDSQRFFVILRWPPDAVAGDAHGAEAEAVDRDVTAEEKRAALGRI